MKRAAIYARYSSENQRDASIEDQIEVCRRYAVQHGFEVIATFQDRALSGASSNRPGYRDLLAQSRRGSFDVVIVEALDRLARKLSDVASLHDELQFHGMSLHAVNVGAVTTMHVGMLGTMAQMFLSDLREKTKRGQLGRVLQGKAAAGKAFGYDVVADSERGGRVINPAEAAVVERIFTLFAHGVSPRAIARRLNEEHVPRPDNRLWQDTTIRGQKERGTGILNNELYIGQLVWNRCSYVKDPRTGKRVARPNPPERWERTAVPHLRIIDDALWHEVKRRQERTAFEMARDEQGNALNRARRRRFLLSGLLTCGCCGAGYTIMAKDRYGCAGRRSKGTCSNERTISRKEIEARILKALKQNLLTPELVAEFTRAYQEEVNRLTKEVSGRAAEVETKLAAVQRKIDGIMRAIEDGLYQPSMKARLEELETEKAALISSRDTGPTIPNILVHPNLAAVYRRKVDELESLLEDAAHKDKAMELIRSLIEKIELSPREEGGLDAVLHGDLARILTLCSTGADVAKETTPVHAVAVAGSGQAKTLEGQAIRGFSVSVVAGTGFEPVTFRL
ncbi:recombinase family protein [Microvirga sp. GCM10011540]|uniref:recombinase family protein n=1 Tax=Microvirga sp. GCM10011540 TaxID=3317338 RepID=UPI00362382E1